MLRFGRANVEAIHFLKHKKTATIEFLKKYAKTNLNTLETAYAYLKTALPDAPYPNVEGMKTYIAEAGRTQKEIAKTDPASFVDSSIVKSVEKEGFLKSLSH